MAISDQAWINEGLFAFCQDLRRLSKLDSDRANLPTTDLEVVSG